MPRPVFISLDGLDGTGKSTQCRLLADWLRSRGREVTLCADPGSTPVGEEIRELLLHRRHEMVPACEAFLFMASRAQLTAEVIQPALAARRDVVTDRYLLSNIVYQGHAGGLPADRLWEIGRLATGGLEPDLSLVLDLQVEAALRRRVGAADRVESRDADYHSRVRSGFLLEARRHPDRICVIDAGKSIDEVHEQICRQVERMIQMIRKPH
jgi:dTMP kinase